MDLRYKYFGVRAEMIVNNVEVVSKSGFVTLVDLALSVAWAVKRLAVGQDAAFNFTEGAEIIRLRHEGNLITLSSSLKPWTVSVGREQLVEALGEFLRKAHTCLVSDVPELAGNAVIQRFSPE
ncbi:hypothetical protein [Streptomyces sp. NPDC046685]|uniref:hypothetical protein n=1 Tax=Streptomyces sp. NPDC046685 TaxID=3157202 RepID=UPI003406C50F